MNRRIEFSLNMDNPQEAALYEALSGLLRHRRAGEVIRQALTAYLFEGTPIRPAPSGRHSVVPNGHIPANKESSNSIDLQTTDRIVAQSAAMFGF
jgi:hypothetical protein